jgi:hypothetical protein
LGRRLDDSRRLKRGAYAVYHRHVDVEENDVGRQFDDLFDGFLSVRDLAADLEAVLIQKRAYAGSRR